MAGFLGNYIGNPGGVGGGAITSGQVTSGDFGPNSVTSGVVGSGAVFGRLAGGVYTIASGSIGALELGSGITIPLTSGQSSGSFNVALQLSDSTFTAGETISGGKAAAFTQSGILQIAMASVSGRMPAIGIVRGNFTSGQLVTLHLAGQLFNVPQSGTPWNFSGWMNQPLYVGASGDIVASGAPIGSGNIQQIVGTSICQSGLMMNILDPLEGVVVASGDIGSGGITGQAGGGFFNIASGTLGTYDGSSGMLVYGANTCSPFNSGPSWTMISPLTEETISGHRAVCVSQSGNIRIAMASVSGRMPAIGVVMDNILSGRPAIVYTQGGFQCTSGMSNFSGYLGKPIWVGGSGQIVSFSGSWNSGGFNVSSGGDFVQRLGVIINSGAFIVNPDSSLMQQQLLGVLDLVDVVNRGFGV